MRAGRDESGQILVALLAFIATGLIITVTAAAVTATNVLTNSKYTSGEKALQVAEGGIDNAMMRLVRDPAYTGETLTIGTGTATITVSGTAPYTILSKGTIGNFHRTVQVTATRSNNAFTISSWAEVP
jgi:hypothetical protein